MSVRQSVKATQYPLPAPLARFSFSPSERNCSHWQFALRRPRRIPQSTACCRRKASNIAGSSSTSRHWPTSRAQRRDDFVTVTTTNAKDVDGLYDLVSRLLKQNSVPTEEDVLLTLKSIKSTSRELLGIRSRATATQSEDGSSTSAILSLASQAEQGRAPSIAPATSLKLDKSRKLETLSELAYKTVKHPPVFITPAILSEYVSIQSLLSRPSTFPEVFRLYASKPIPKPSSSTTIEYSPANPTSLKAAIPPAVANAALQSALRVRSLELALSIVSNAYASPSFRRNKLFRRALVPVIGTSLAPIAVYVLAANMAEQQTGLSSESFTQVAFAGMLTYTACVGSIGWVALATANDQMQRVTWVEGMPLRERWLREEERSALDRIACEWGFKEKWRWGEEEGQEWENLKEWMGHRGMILDKISLMEGME